MAQRRMFSPDVVATDAFIEMPTTAQALYFHLGMRADDDGFVNPQITMRMMGANGDDLKILLGKNFLIPFPNGVVVVKHWRMNNFIRKDRYKPTNYIEEKSQLYVKENMAYTLDKSQGLPVSKADWNNQSAARSTIGQPNDIPTVNAGKDRIGKDRIGRNRIKEKSSSSSSFLRTVPQEVLIAFSDEYGISPKGIQSKATDLLLWCQSKGKQYKDYKSFLENAIRKDQVQLRSQYPAKTAVAVPLSVQEADISPEQIEANKARIAAMRSELAEAWKS